MRAKLTAVRSHPRPASLRQTERAARRRARHDAATRAEHSRFRTGVLRYIAEGEIISVLVAPVIYSILLPFLLLDAWVSLYEAVCFRAWGLRRVRRRDFLAIDRHRLAYLNPLEKLNCLYCSYANGLIGYVREVAARTEQYWCPIRHARRVHGAPERTAAFAAYGDARAYRTRQAGLRAAIRR